jgi:hypothetical protein
MRSIACVTMFALASLAPGCSKSAEKYEPPPAPPAKPPEPPPPLKKIGPADFGTCTLKATGAFTADEVVPADAKSAASKYWQAEDQRGVVPMPALSVNCAGQDVRVSFVAAPSGTVPYGVKTYDIKKDGELVLIGRAGDQLSDFKGTVVINEFNNKHVTGTIDVTALQGRARKKVAITGTFDLACPGMAGCAK